jgi:hypothetical protein
MNFQAYSLKNYPEWACIQTTTPDSQTRTPVHLCCVIDVSASMDSQDKLDNVKKSLHFLIDFLGPSDKLSIITFSETGKTFINQINVIPSEKENIRTQISILRTESNTNLSSGIVTARKSLLSDTSEIKQGILLLTDGHANLGLTHSPDILELVKNTINQFPGTSISSIGYGTDHNVELLQSITTESGGSYYVVNNLEDVAVVFGDILGGLVSCVAQQVSILLPMGTEIKSRYATNKINNNLEVIIGDMPSGSEATFLAKIPNATQLTLKGYNLQTHNDLKLDTTVINTDDITLQTNGQAHYLRFEVLSLIDEARTMLLHPTSNQDVDDLVSRIEVYISKINTHKDTHEHSLWDILLRELNTCNFSLKHRHTINIDTPNIMSQHAGYLGRMRGIPANIPTPSVLNSNDYNTTIPLERTFSNYAQRNISSQLQASVTPHVRRARASTDSNDPHNNTLTPSTTPFNQLSPVIGAAPRVQFNLGNFNINTNSNPINPNI